MMDVRFKTPAKVTDWTYLWVTEQGSWDPFRNKDFNEIFKNFRKALRNQGVNEGQFHDGRKLQKSDLQGSLMPAKFEKAPGKTDPKLIFIVLPSDDKDFYNDVKRAADIKVGVHTVCAVASKFARDSIQYFANVALKFNLKFGGTNQTMDPSKLGIIAHGKTMVVGLDVTHPSPGSLPNAPSIAGIVASTDATLSQFPGKLQIQERRKEMVSNLDDLLLTRLKLWSSRNGGRLPENILVYRDGVSEGQYQAVLDEEFPQLRKACEEAYPPSDIRRGVPNITIVIVGKRHHTRFYPTQLKDGDANGNPQPGTVVDRGVTEARNWEFYLQAHNALQGTVRPAHYFVVHDEIFAQAKINPPFANAADALEDLTHNMCYLFPRATRAVSICPPAYLADLLCERGRVYLQRLYDPPFNQRDQQPNARQSEVEIHKNLVNSMFYL